jgi:CCR4-NOT transcription complex subunit 7/8
MELLKESGLDFSKHKSDGIPHTLFAEYLITSGLLLNPRCHWITFAGGVDFGYLLKYVRGVSLPANEKLFLNELKLYFQNFYDCKELMRELNITGGLTKVAR